MSNLNTKIEWTDVTWSPVTGCTRVSEGCRHCYIENTPPMRMHDRRFEGPDIGASTKGGVQLHPDRLDQPLRWRKPRRVFVNSMSDLFHDDVPDVFIADVFARMGAADRHVFQVLTKRPRRMQTLLSSEDFWATVNRAHVVAGFAIPSHPLPNVWLGVSVENQEWADKRIPLLLETPAAVRFLSCEPLLGPIDLGPWIREWQEAWAVALGDAPGESGRSYRPSRLHWVIVGGESGPGARPVHPDWARSLRDQCDAAGIPFFFKQWGEFVPAEVEDDSQFFGGRAFDLPRGGRSAVLPGDRKGYKWLADDLIAVKVGKKRAGRELDGRTWDEMPEVARV